MRYIKTNTISLKLVIISNFASLQYLDGWVWDVVCTLVAVGGMGVEEVWALVAVCGMEFALWWQRVGWALHFGGSRWEWALHFGGSRWDGLCTLLAAGGMGFVLCWQQVGWALLFDGSIWNGVLHFGGSRWEGICTLLAVSGKGYAVEFCYLQCAAFYRIQIGAERYKTLELYN